MSVFNCALVSVLLCNYIAETLVGGGVVPLCFFIAVSWSTFVFTELQLEFENGGEEGQSGNAWEEMQCRW